MLAVTVAAVETLKWSVVPGFAQPLAQKRAGWVRRFVISGTWVGAALASAAENAIATAALPIAARRRKRINVRLLPSGRLGAWTLLHSRPAVNLEL
jgi:hypothetical protein